MIEATLEQTQVLHNQLKESGLALSSRQAFSIIYFYQERLYTIPDHFEQCHTCLELYDTWQEDSSLADDTEPYDDITQEMITEATKDGGYSFCDGECEADFWREWKDNKEQDNE